MNQDLKETIKLYATGTHKESIILFLNLNIYEKDIINNNYCLINAGM